MKFKIKDWLLLSFVSGLVGTVAVDLINLPFWKRNKTEMMYGSLAGSIIMRGIRTKRRENFIIGQIYHMLTGGVLGIFNFLVLKTSGKDHYLIKGVLSGAIIWGTLNNIGQRLGLFRAKMHSSTSFYVSLLGNCIYGLVTASTLVTLAGPKMFNEGFTFKQNNEKSVTDIPSNESINQKDISTE